MCRLHTVHCVCSEQSLQASWGEHEQFESGAQCGESTYRGWGTDPALAFEDEISGRPNSMKVLLGSLI